MKNLGKPGKTRKNLQKPEKRQYIVDEEAEGARSGHVSGGVSREVREAKMGLKSINHTSFTVSDAGAVARWYCEMLDFVVVSDERRPQDYSEKVTGIPGADLRIVYIRGGGYLIELVEYVGAPGVKIDSSTNNVGSAHIAYNVSGLAEMYRTLAPRGVKFVSEPVPITQGANKGGLVVYVEDPDGNTLELIERPGE